MNPIGAVLPPVQHRRKAPEPLCLCRQSQGMHSVDVPCGCLVEAVAGMLWLPQGFSGLLLDGQGAGKATYLNAANYCSCKSRIILSAKNRGVHQNKPAGEEPTSAFRTRFVHHHPAHPLFSTVVFIPLLFWAKPALKQGRK